MLWKLAQHLSDARGKNDINRIDYSFVVDWDARARTGAWRSCRASAAARSTSSIAELMIHVNNTWGRLLADHGAAGLYRVQSGGQGQDEHAARRAPGPGPHALPVGELAAAPLQRSREPAPAPRRACAGETPPYGDNDADLFAALADFEATYSQYAEFQDRMEHYWCLRWLLQEDVTETGARVIRENLVRFEPIPLVATGGGPAAAAARHAGPRRRSGAIDLLAATLECRYAGPAVMTRGHERSRIQ